MVFPRGSFQVSTEEKEDCDSCGQHDGSQEASESLILDHESTMGHFSLYIYVYMYVYIYLLTYP
jgi:hypothetical protein